MLKKKLACLFMFRAISALGGVLLLYLISKEFNVEIVGDYLIALSFLGFLLLFMRVGIDSLIVKKTSIFFFEKNRSGFLEFKRRIYLIVLINYLLFMFVYFFILKKYGVLDFSNGGDYKLYDIVVIFSFFLCLMQVHVCLFKGLGITWLYPVFEFGFLNFIVSIFMFLCFYFGFLISFYSYMIFMCLLAVMFVVCGEYFFYKKIFSQFTDNSPFSTRFFECFLGWQDFLLLAILAFTITGGVPFFVSGILDVLDIAVFSICFRISIVVGFFVTIVNSIYAPRFSVSCYRSDFKELKFNVDQSGKWIFLTCFPVILCLFFFSELVLRKFSIDNVDAKYILWVLLLGQLINVSTGSVTTLMNMVGLEKENKNITFFSSIFCFFMIFFLGNVYGVLGVSASISLYWVLKNAISAFLIKKIAGVNVLGYLKVW